MLRHVAASVFLMTACGVAPWPGAAAGEVLSGAITPQNWQHHPRILEVRKLYDNIQSKLATKELKYQKKDYTVLPRSCRGTYPLEYLALAADADGRIRMYTRAHRISHDDLLTTRYYYDDKGRPRFSYVTNESDEFSTIEYRIYLDDQGNMFWDVRSEAKKMRFGEASEDLPTVEAFSAKQAATEFQEAKIKCAE
jgi:hypothetical protein